MNYFKKIKRWFSERWTPEKEWQAYQRGWYDSNEQWKTILARSQLQAIQMQPTGKAPVVMVAQKTQNTQPLSLRQIAQGAEYRNVLKSNKLEFLDDDVSDVLTERLHRVILDDIPQGINTFRKPKMYPENT